MKTMEDLFLHLLKDIYYAEKQILRALPKMAKKAETPELKQAFAHHRDETEGQIQRLESVFEHMEKPARAVKCEAIMGLIEESKEIMEEGETPEVIDAGLLAGAQAVEHYEIARYGTMVAMAEQLGMKDAMQLLQQNLNEEKKADELLTRIAKSTVNRKAA